MRTFVVGPRLPLDDLAKFLEGTEMAVGYEDWGAWIYTRAAPEHSHAHEYETLRAGDLVVRDMDNHVWVERRRIA